MPVKTNIFSVSGKKTIEFSSGENQVFPAIITPPFFPWPQKYPALSGLAPLRDRLNIALFNTAKMPPGVYNGAFVAPAMQAGFGRIFTNAGVPVRKPNKNPGGA